MKRPFTTLLLLSGTTAFAQISSEQTAYEIQTAAKNKVTQLRIYMNDLPVCDSVENAIFVFNFDQSGHITSYTTGQGMFGSMKYDSKGRCTERVNQFLGAQDVSYVLPVTKDSDKKYRDSIIAFYAKDSSKTVNRYTFDEFDRPVVTEVIHGGILFTRSENVYKTGSPDYYTLNTRNFGKKTYKDTTWMENDSLSGLLVEQRSFMGNNLYLKKTWIYYPNKKVKEMREYAMEFIDSLRSVETFTYYSSGGIHTHSTTQYDYNWKKKMNKIKYTDQKTYTENGLKIKYSSTNMDGDRIDNNTYSIEYKFYENGLIKELKEIDDDPDAKPVIYTYLYSYN